MLIIQRERSDCKLEDKKLVGRNKNLIFMKFNKINLSMLNRGDGQSYTFYIH